MKIHNNNISIFTTFQRAGIWVRVLHGLTESVHVYLINTIFVFRFTEHSTAEQFQFSFKWLSRKNAMKNINISIGI